MFLCADDVTKVAAEGGQSLFGTPYMQKGGASTAVRLVILLNFDQKTRQSKRNGRDF
jgi:hypothetical protein